jgi:hypothetical protein
MQDLWISTGFSSPQVLGFGKMGIPFFWKRMGFCSATDVVGDRTDVGLGWQMPAFRRVMKDACLRRFFLHYLWGLMSTFFSH